MNNGIVSDAVCVFASCVLVAMSLIAVIEEFKASYEVVTGFFCAFICLGPLLLRRKGVFELPLTLVILIEVAIFLHGYGVLLMRYDDLLFWDTLTHIISSLTVSLCVFYALMAVNIFDPMVRIPRKFMPFIIVLIGLAFGAFWESFEFVVDELTGTHMQYSPWDTVRDLVCDVVGAAVIGIYSYFYLGRKSEEEFIEGLKIHPKAGRIAKSRG